MYACIVILGYVLGPLNHAESVEAMVPCSSSNQELSYGNIY